MKRQKFTWYEFFAGGGMARLGLGTHWKCVFANEWCEKKARAYQDHFGRGEPRKSGELVISDVANLKTFPAMQILRGPHFHAKTSHWLAREPD
jgi:site-specific DNA-cytosine methylase